MAEFAYDALGRRIKKVDSVAGTTRIYYYNNDWQILSEYDGSNYHKKSYFYGNYIDEVLMSFVVPINSSCKYYVHDHLHSPTALLWYTGLTVERYEYDAYGNCYVLEPNFAPDPDNKTDYGNPYYFTGRQLDFLDGGDLKIQYNRNRYYDYYTGRWLTQDVTGYVDAMNLYEYVKSWPTAGVDPRGQACIGLGAVGGGTLMLPTTSLYTVGLSATYSTKKYGCYTRKKGFFCKWCDSAALTVLSGVGANLSVTVGPEASIVWQGEPYDGPTVSFGVGGGIGAPGISPKFEITVDVDIQAHEVTIGFPRFGPGIVAYFATRVSGKCTGCSAKFSQIGVRWAKISACMRNVANAIANAVRSLDGTLAPENYSPVDLVFTSPHEFSEGISDDRCD